MSDQQVRVVGRYALYQSIAAGGMATVHLGRLIGPVGFSRTVAIKRLHAQFAADPEFVSMFLDEARLAARIRHPNVVPTLDVVTTDGELFLVMDYVPGESVARLAHALRERNEPIPLRILTATIAGVLHGLHAAHEAKDERGQPLGIVHRDVSPQNVLLGVDGVPRVLDFGVAKAAGRVQTTREGQLKGKLSYMPPEQLRGADVNRATDIYSVGVMLWELVTGQRLFGGDNEGVIVAKILEGHVDPPSRVVRATGRFGLGEDVLRMLETLDGTILRALAMQPERRFATARDMALELERKCPPATASECGDWVEAVARTVLSSRAAMVAEIESSASVNLGPHSGDVLSVLGTREPGTGSSPGLQLQTGVTATSLVEHPPVTQPSSISVSTVMQHDDGGGGRRTLFAAFIGIMIGASLLACLLVYRASKRTAQPLADPVASGSVVVPPPTTSVAAPTTKPTTSGSALAPPIELAEEDAGGPVVVTRPPPMPAPGPAPVVVRKPNPAPPPRPPPAPPPAVQPNNDCTPPYWFDSQGVKHFKEQCVGK